MSLVNVLERQGEKRWLELITVRTTSAACQHPENPQEETKKGKGRAGPEQTSKSLPKKGHALSESNLLFKCHSKYNLSLKRTLYSTGTEANQTATF